MRTGYSAVIAVSLHRLRDGVEWWRRLEAESLLGKMTMPRDPRLLVIPLAYLYALLPSVPYVETIARPFVFATAHFVAMALVVALIALLRSPSGPTMPTKQPWWMVAAAVSALVVLLIER